MLDRGELKDWFHSSEIWIEVTVAGLGFYLFTVHTVTTDERSFLNRDLLKSTNFVVGTVLMFCGGLIMTGILALLPTMLQNLMNYPALSTLPRHIIIQGTAIRSLMRNLGGSVGISILV